jgi:hypothetical protein
MDDKSFYNLDYIIEVNEKRHEQYTSAYQKVLERFTNIILIYSAITIFLIPLIQELLVMHTKSLFFAIGFCLFAILFIISIVYTVKLIIPVDVAYLEIPKKYYIDIRLQYEQTITDTEQIKNLLKASYITELEAAVTNNERVFRRKSSFFYNALLFALLSVIPYLVCLGLHISKKDDNIQKVEIINNKEN